MDPADLEAIAWSELGFTCQLRHPRLSGGRGYDDDVFFLLQLQIAKSKYDAHQAIDVSRRSIYCWKMRIVSYCKTGNASRTQIIGADLLSFINFHTAYLDATLDEMVISIFIFNEGGLLYSHQTIPKLHDHDTLGITKKKVSTEAYQAQRMTTCSSTCIC